MPVAETLPSCRRKALIMLAVGLACLLLAWAAHAARWPISDVSLGLLVGIGAGGLFSAVLLWFSPDTSDAVPKALMRRYRREFIPALVRAAVAVGVDALFMEIHPDPPEALCDAACMLSLADLPGVLASAKAIENALA